MKEKLLLTPLLLLVINCFSQTMQGTIKPGSTPRTIDVYLKPSATFSQKDEAMTFVLAIPATVTPAPSMGSAGVTPNGTGPVTGITGLQPNFLINGLGSTSRELVVSTQTINSNSYYIYTFIFANTAAANHSWTGGVEQLIFSIQFNGCTANCDPNSQLMVNLSNGGTGGNAYWYFQPNTLGDITNYAAPFYVNPQSSTPNNGGSSDGSVLSVIGLANSVSLPIKLSAFNAQLNGCNTSLAWQTSAEINADFFSVERSDGGLSFREIGRVKAVSQGGNLQSYSFVDNPAFTGNLYYRLRLVDKDGKFSYSSINEINMNCGGKGRVIAYPTFTSGVVTVRLPMGYENATIKVINSIGKEVMIDAIKSETRYLSLGGLSNGVYILQVTNKGKMMDNIKIVLHK